MRNQRRRSLFLLHRKHIPQLPRTQSFKSLSIFSGCTARFVSDLVGDPEDRFCHDTAHNLPYLFRIYRCRSVYTLAYTNIGSSLLFCRHVKEISTYIQHYHFHNCLDRIDILSPSLKLDKIWRTSNWGAYANIVIQISFLFDQHVRRGTQLPISFAS